jgi:hypothetical protein
MTGTDEQTSVGDAIFVGLYEFYRRSLILGGIRRKNQNWASQRGRNDAIKRMRMTSVTGRWS